MPRCEQDSRTRCKNEANLFLSEAWFKTFEWSKVLLQQQTEEPMQYDFLPNAKLTL